MATILYTWELGGGLGHLVPIAPILERLAAAGHHVVAALRDRGRAREILGAVCATVVQAPHFTPPSSELPLIPRSYVHVLNAAGFARVEELRASMSAWRRVFDTVRPDLIVCDHSPSAVFASRGLDVKRVLIGNGFFCPPDCTPLPDLRPWLPAASRELAADEYALLSRVNQVLGDGGQEALRRVSQFYAEVDATLLTTFRELDPYVGRDGAEYWGVLTPDGGVPAAWPRGEGPRVFAYLKAFPFLSVLMERLSAWRCRTIVYFDGVNAEWLERLARPGFRFERSRVDMRDASVTCDLAILNAGHGSTAQMLLAGKPVLLLPLYLEQRLTGEAVVRLGAGAMAPPSHPDEVIAKLDTMLDSDRFAAAAQEFAARYVEFDSTAHIGRITEILDRLVRGSRTS